ncbi:MAG: NADH-quinone oxidoreductase subunit C [Bacteroidota bacterium]
MTSIDNDYLLDILQEKLGTDLYHSETTYGILSIEINRHKNIELLTFLRDHKELQMSFMTDLCGAHFPDHKNKELVVIYHLHSLVNNIRLRIKCFMPETEQVIDSAVEVFPAANWMERETFDFFGIKFKGHPNLIRILNMESMTYHPLRKEYPLEDASREDKQDKFFGR